MKRSYLLISFCLVVINAFAQPAKAVQVKAMFDRDQIKIGEQTNYTLSIESKDSIGSVQTPQDTIAVLKTLGGLEVVATRSNLSKTNGRYLFTQQYTLTQFDEGSYEVPGGTVQVNGQPIDFSPANLEVVNIPIDTTELKIFDIKPVDAIGKSADSSNWLVWVIIIVIIAIIVLIYYLFFKYEQIIGKKKQEQPIHEQTLATLSDDHSSLLKTNQYKQYYSKIFDAYRLYIDHELNIPAMEYTSHQLMVHLEKKITDQRFKEIFDKETLKQLAQVFQAADLAKFAKINPDEHQALTDQKFLLENLKAIDSLLEKDREDARVKAVEAAQKAHTRKITWFAITTIFVVSIGLLSIISIDKRYGHEMYRLLGMETEYLYQKDWVSSFYGNPSVSLQTPNYLKRQAPSQDQTLEVFTSGSLDKKMMLHLMTKQMPINEETPASEVALQVKESILPIMEQLGAKKIIEGESSVDDESVSFSGFFDTDYDVIKSYKGRVFATKKGIVSLIIIYDRGNKKLLEIAKDVHKSMRIEK